MFRAKTLTDGTRLDPTSVFSIQLMLSKFECVFWGHPFRRLTAGSVTALSCAMALSALTVGHGLHCLLSWEGSC